MPMLTLTGDAWDCHFVMARMLYPNDESAATDYWCARTSKSFDSEGRTRDTPQIIDQQLRDAPSRAEIESEVIQLQSRGENAGSIIWSIREALDRKEEPSINGALRKRSDDLRSASQKLDGRAKFNLSVDRVKNDWKDFRPVAHLWAAFFCSFMLPHINDKNLLGHEVMSSDLPHFLAVAEDYRRFGESWVSKRSGRGRYTARLLDPGATWKVPASYGLPDVQWNRPLAHGGVFPPTSG